MKNSRISGVRPRHNVKKSRHFDRGRVKRGRAEKSRKTQYKNTCYFDMLGFKGQGVKKCKIIFTFCPANETVHYTLVFLKNTLWIPPLLLAALALGRNDVIFLHCAEAAPSRT